MKEAHIAQLIERLSDTSAFRVRPDGVYAARKKSPYSYVDYIEQHPHLEEPLTKKEFSQVIAGMIDNRQDSAESVYCTTRELVKDFFKRNPDIRFNPLGYFEDHAGAFPVIISVPAIITRITYFGQKLNSERKALQLPLAPFSKDTLMGEMALQIHEYTNREQMNIYEEIKYNPNSEFCLDGWVNHIFDVYGIRRDVEPSKVMFKHWLWSLKRSLAQKPVEYKFMFVFYSSIQGIGKTTLVRKINQLWPNGYTEDFTFAEMLKKNDLKAMLRGIICGDLQEMAGIDSIEAADLKKNLTMNMVSGRGMYSHANEKEPVYTNFVSTSNISLSEAIYDSTGMRRYFQFIMEPENPYPFTMLNGALDREVIVEVFRNIDENDPKGFYVPNGTPEQTEVARKVIEIQEGYSNAENRLLKFCASIGIEVYAGVGQSRLEAEAEGYVEMNMQAFVRRFNRWLQARGDRQWKYNTIESNLRNKYFFIDTWTEGGKEVSAVFTRAK